MKLEHGRRIEMHMPLVAMVMIMDASFESHDISGFGGG